MTLILVIIVLVLLFGGGGYPTRRDALAASPLARRLHFQPHQPTQPLNLLFAHRPALSL
jgi:hypothetical protein